MSSLCLKIGREICCNIGDQPFSAPWQPKRSLQKGLSWPCWVPVLWDSPRDPGILFLAFGGQCRAWPSNICPICSSGRPQAPTSALSLPHRQGQSCSFTAACSCCGGSEHCGVSSTAQGAGMCQSQASRWPWALCDCQGLPWVLNWEPGVSDCINQQLIFYLYREKNKIQSYFRNVQAIYIWLLHLWDTWPALCKQMAAASWAGVKPLGINLQRALRGQSRDMHTSTCSGVKPNHAHLVNLMLKIK